MHLLGSLTRVLVTLLGLALVSSMDDHQRKCPYWAASAAPTRLLAEEPMSTADRELTTSASCPSAVLRNGMGVTIGVRKVGGLNADPTDGFSTPGGFVQVGLRSAEGLASMEPGCLCEGWAVQGTKTDTSVVNMYFNRAGGDSSYASASLSVSGLPTCSGVVSAGASVAELIEGIFLLTL